MPSSGSVRSCRQPVYPIVPLRPPNLRASPDMTLVTRSVIRLSRRGGQTLRNARANAAFFNTAANQAQNVLPKFSSQSSRVNLPAKQGEFAHSAQV